MRHLAAEDGLSIGLDRVPSGCMVVPASSNAGQSTSVSDTPITSSREVLDGRSTRDTAARVGSPTAPTRYDDRPSGTARRARTVLDDFARPADAPACRERGGTTRRIGRRRRIVRESRSIHRAEKTTCCRRSRSPPPARDQRGSGAVPIAGSARRRWCRPLLHTRVGRRSGRWRVGVAFAATPCVTRPACSNTRQAMRMRTRPPYSA